MLILEYEMGLIQTYFENKFRAVIYALNPLLYLKI